MCKKGKESKIPLKDDDKDAIDAIANQMRIALQRKEAALSTEDKLKAGEAIENAKNAQKLV